MAPNRWNKHLSLHSVQAQREAGTNDMTLNIEDLLCGEHEDFA